MENENINEMTEVTELTNVSATPKADLKSFIGGAAAGTLATAGVFLLVPLVKKGVRALRERRMARKIGDKEVDDATDQVEEINEQING